MQIISGIFLQYFSAEIQMRWKSDESDRESSLPHSSKDGRRLFERKDGVGDGIRVLGGEEAGYVAEGRAEDGVDDACF